MQYDTQLHAKWKSALLTETPPPGNLLQWLAYREGKADRAWEQMRLIEEFADAIAEKRVEVVPFPELAAGLKPGYAPRVTRKLADLIDGSIESNPMSSRDGYAWDLTAMSLRYAGPESPIGWVPFGCHIGEELRGCIAGILGIDGEEQDWMVFALIDEVLAFAGDPALTA